MHKRESMHARHSDYQTASVSVSTQTRKTSVYSELLIRGQVSRKLTWGLDIQYFTLENIAKTSN